MAWLPQQENAPDLLGASPIAQRVSVARPYHQNPLCNQTATGAFTPAGSTAGAGALAASFASGSQG